MRQMMHYAARQEILQSDGLHDILQSDYPCTWGQPAKAMMEDKGLNSVERAQDPIPIGYHDRIKQTYLKIPTEL